MIHFSVVFLWIIIIVQIISVHSWITSTTTTNFPSASDGPRGALNYGRPTKSLSRLYYLPNQNLPQQQEEEKQQDDETQGGTSSSSSSKDFFIRESLMVDMGTASDILADGFFKDNTNFLTYQLERLQTYLSLESGFPKPFDRHQIFVACEVTKGQVIAMAEVDARIEGDDARGTNGPYMCNIAVHKDYQRMGIATALVEKCEEQVQEWVSSTTTTTRTSTTDPDATTALSSSLYLKVRQSNKAAVSMYDKIGYRSIGQEIEEKTNSVVLIMRKELPRPPPAVTSSVVSSTSSSSMSSPSSSWWLEKPSRLS